MAAYFSVALALGLKIGLISSLPPKEDKAPKLPKKIRVSSYKQLKKLAWQLDKNHELSPQEAMNLYERNWRHVDLKTMDTKEKAFLDNLLRAFKRERLLV
ncbi:hypothetical protein D3C87_1805550 [compost metagenome]